MKKVNHGGMCIYVGKSRQVAKGDRQKVREESAGRKAQFILTSWPGQLTVCLESEL